MEKKINTPITEEVTKELRSGDYVYITGYMYVARDAAHKRMIETLEEGKELPIDIKDATIMACVDDDENNSVYKNIDKSVNVLDLSAKNPNLYTYFVDYTADGNRQIVLFQPTSKMVEALWKFNPRAVKKYNI